LFLATSATAFADGQLSDSPILYIGDSISDGPFGEYIDSALRQISSKVLTEASCGSSPKNWLPQTGPNPAPYAETPCGFWKKTGPNLTDEYRTGKNEKHITPQITEELASFQPQVTLVQLGTNIAVNPFPTALLSTVRDMIQDILSAGSKCIWIGPPNANSPNITQKSLIATDLMIHGEADRQGCYYIRSMDFATAPPNTGPDNDGIHPGPELARTWANGVLALATSVVMADIASDPSHASKTPSFKRGPAHLH
jgi:hypothetical protein